MEDKGILVMFVLTKSFIDEFKFNTVSISSWDVNRYQDKLFHFGCSSNGIFLAIYHRNDGGICEIYSKSDLKPGSIRVYFDGQGKTLETDKDVYELRSTFKLKAFW